MYLVTLAGERFSQVQVLDHVTSVEHRNEKYLFCDD